MAIVPFDVGVVTSPQAGGRYEVFVVAARAAGLRVWSLGGIYDAYGFDGLTVNRLDRHPNELAHELAAAAVLGYMTSDSTLQGR